MFVCNVSLGIEGDAYRGATQALNLNLTAVLAYSYLILEEAHHSAETVGTIEQFAIVLSDKFQSYNFGCHIQLLSVCHNIAHERTLCKTEERIGCCQQNYTDNHTPATPGGKHQLPTLC